MLVQGRFRHGERIFYGDVQGESVTERHALNGPTDAEARPRWDYGELVLLCPAEPKHIIEATSTGSGTRFRLRPPASLGPHRAMVAIPRGHATVTASTRIGYVIKRDLDRASVAEAEAALVGAVTAIVFQDEALFHEDPGSPASIAHEGFTTLGPTITPMSAWPEGYPSLWHNGCEQAGGILHRGAPSPATLLAEISAWIRLGSGDLVLFGSEQGSARIRAGDHVECRCPPLRPAAVNIGLRGSA